MSWKQFKNLLPSHQAQNFASYHESCISASRSRSTSGNIDTLPFNQQFHVTQLNPCRMGKMAKDYYQQDFSPVSIHMTHLHAY